MLPIYTTNDKNFTLMQNTWSRTINPVIDNILNKASLLMNVNLVSGVNTINHMLGNTLTGWFIVGQNASASFYDEQATNPTPQLTLILHSSGSVTVNIAVF